MFDSSVLVQVMNNIKSGQSASSLTQARLNGMCAPKNISTGQWIRVFVKYLDDNPQYLNKSVSINSTAALKNTIGAKDKVKLKIVTKEDLKDWTKELFQDKSFNMIDVSDKEITLRRALATGSIIVGSEVFNLIKSQKMPKEIQLHLQKLLQF